MIRIVLIADESDSAQDIQGQLQRMSYEVTAVTATTDDVITHVDDLRPDVILMDVRLKGDVDGVEAAQEIKRLHDVPIIFITADTDEATVLRAIAAEPDGFLIKPLDKLELIAAIDVAIKKHQKEQQARASERRIRELTDSLTQITFETDGNGAFTFVNAACFPMFGYTKEELETGITIFDIIVPDERSWAHEGFKRSMGGEKIGLVERTGLRKDGSTFPLAIRAVTFERNGAVVGTRGLILDTTKRYRAEAELKSHSDDYERQAQLRAASLYARSLIEASLDPLVTINADGKITDVNKTTEEVTGYPRDELIGSDFSDYFTEPSEANAGYKRVFTDGFVRDYPLAIRHKSGRITDVLYNATVYRNEAGEIQGIFAAARDITERKEAEELRRAHNKLKKRTAELARSNADLKQFAYVASHDLQEPLRAVVSYLQLLERRYAGKLDERADKYIIHAVEGGLRMQGLINDLLAYSRVETLGKKLQVVDVERVVDDALRNLRVAIRENDAVISRDPMPALRADQIQLTQVFQNLVANAIKFRREAPPEIHIGAQPQDDGWRFSVTDNGIGIDMKHADRIFVIFQRLHTRRAYEGTGIGLAICKRIIERHDGQMWVESELEKGSIFYFTLPNR